MARGVSLRTIGEGSGGEGADRASRAVGGARSDGEQFLSLAENLVPTGVPLEKLAKVANSLYKKWGIGTGKTRVESVPLPVGEAIVRVVCSMARRGQAIRQVQQANNGCRIESAFPSDFFSLEGDFIVTVERISSQTMVTAQTRIGGQWFDWGKASGESLGYSMIWRPIRQTFGS